MNRTVQIWILFWKLYLYFISVPQSSVFPANYLYMKLCPKWIKNHEALTHCSWSKGRWGRWGTRVSSWLPDFPTGLRGSVHCLKKHPLAPWYKQELVSLGVEEVTPWRRLTSVLHAPSVSAEGRTPSAVKRNFEDNESDSYKSGSRDF